MNVLKGNEAEWRWVLDVNLFGILHGLQVFTPVVAQQARPCLISCTASTQGLDIGGAGLDRQLRYQQARYRTCHFH